MKSYSWLSVKVKVQNSTSRTNVSIKMNVLGTMMSLIVGCELNGYHLLVST